jgi:hypothetical protein
MLETPIQRSILDLLMMKGVKCWRSQPTPVPIRRGKAIVGLRRVDPHLKGMPDISAIIKGQYIGIEVKTATGKQEPDQKRWEQEIVKAGGVYILARSTFDVMNGLAAKSIFI